MSNRKEDVRKDRGLDSARKAVEAWEKRTGYAISSKTIATKAAERLTSDGCSRRTLSQVLDCLRIYLASRDARLLRDRGDRISKERWRDNTRNLTITLRRVAKRVQNIEEELLALAGSGEAVQEMPSTPKTTDGVDSDSDNESGDTKPSGATSEERDSAARNEQPRSSRVRISPELAARLSNKIPCPPTPTLASQMRDFADNLEGYVKIDKAEFDFTGKLFSKRLGGTLIFLVFAVALVEMKTGAPHFKELADLIQGIAPEARVSEASLGKKVNRFRQRAWDVVVDWMEPVRLEENVRGWITSWDSAMAAFRNR